MSKKHPPKPTLLMAAFFLSGAAALGYEMLWTRLLALFLGHESLAVAGVLMGFFAGMTAGAYLLDNRLARSDNPVHWFAILEIMAAVYAVASPFIMMRLCEMIQIPPPAAGQDLVLRTFLLSVVVASLSVLPSTFCMGATLAALTQAYRRVYRDHARGVGVGRLYAANTLGAMIGVMASAYLLLRFLPFNFAIAVPAGLGVASAVLAFWWSRAQTGINLTTPRSVRPEMGRRRYVVTPLLFLTGAVGIGFELVGVQILSQSSRGTIYTFAHTLSVFLLFTSLGSWMYARVVRKKDGTVGLLPKLLLGYALAILVASLLMHDFIHSVLAPSEGGGPWSEFLLATLFFAGPSFFMGAIFSHLAGHLSGFVGRAYAWNTAGAAVAPLLFGSICVFKFGFTITFYILAGLVVLMFVVVSVFNREPWKRLAIRLALVALLAVLAPRSLRTIRVSEGWHPIWEQEGIMGTVVVTEQDGTEERAFPLRKLQVNQRFYMGGQAGFGERRMGHLPLLLADKPDNALFLGVGTGATLSAVKVFPVKQVDAVEIVPEVVESLSYFNAVNDKVYDDARVSIYVADARRFLRSVSTTYDLVVADLYHPFKDGAAFLYTEEYFTLVRERLTDDGLFVQWLPLHQLDAGTLKIIIRSYLEVFPDASAFLGLFNARMPTLALVSSGAGPLPPLPVARIHETLSFLPAHVRFYRDVHDVMGSFLMDAAQLKQFAGRGVANTDLKPVVLFRAPARGIEAANPGPDNLRALLPDKRAGADILAGEDAGKIPGLLEGYPAYIKALDLYLEADMLMESDPSDTSVQKAVELYHAAYAASANFPAAKGKLFQLAGTFPGRAEPIYARMLKDRRDDLLLYRTYLYWLQRQKRQARFKEIANIAKEHLAPAEFNSLFKR